MQIYFEEFGEGWSSDYLTPMKMYKVVDSADDGTWATIADDEGDEAIVLLHDDYVYTGSSWIILHEENKVLFPWDVPKV